MIFIDHALCGPQDLSFNQLPTLPAAVGGLTQLQVLNLLGNPLAALPRTCAIRRVHEVNTKSVLISAYA